MITEFDMELEDLLSELEAEFEAEAGQEAMLGALGAIGRIGSGLGKLGSLGKLGKLGGLAKAGSLRKLGVLARKPVGAIPKSPRAIGSRSLKQFSRGSAGMPRSYRQRDTLARLARSKANRKYRRRVIPHFTIGEIKPDSRSGRRRGVFELNVGWRSNVPGNRSLVTYDRQGNVFASVWDQSGRRIWNGVVGVVPPREMPRGVQYGSTGFGNEIENSVRRVMQRVTDRRYLVKHPSAGGPDLVPRL